MNKAGDVANASSAAERFFRLYRSHCVSPDVDTLFSFLEAAHSLNDRLRIANQFDFFDVPEFSALKCLRNFFHHHQELRHVVRLVPAGNYPIVTDLMTLCLVASDIVKSAVNETRGRHKEETRLACGVVFHWYGTVVNINPALFNYVVSAYERMTEAGISLNGEAFQEFESRYLYEEDYGYSHRVDGRLATRAGNIDELLAEIMDTSGV
ncbi:hypothetical protein ACSHT2_06095 [Bradyrhizobium sp. PUT101]|uniref:hypothetical protein n=1 Tax=Bradyrhizobium sp. PUT101 TaxID=3447427 RepID=UPI003F83F760